jgi:hypothetical protein
MSNCECDSTRHNKHVMLLSARNPKQPKLPNLFVFKNVFIRYRDSLIKQPLLSRFRGKPRTGLLSPRGTKLVVRWCKRRQNMVAYVTFLSWGKALTLLGFIFALISAATRKPVWLFTSSASLAVVWAIIQLYEAIDRAHTSWKLRHVVTSD